LFFLQNNFQFFSFPIFFFPCLKNITQCFGSNNLFFFFYRFSFSIIPPSKNFLKSKNWVSHKILFSNFSEIFPKLFHVFLFRSIAVEFLFIRKNVGNISERMKGLYCPIMNQSRFSFLHCHHMMINSKY
jgi:hypothetical protein